MSEWKNLWPTGSQAAGRGVGRRLADPEMTVTVEVKADDAGYLVVKTWRRRNGYTLYALNADGSVEAIAKAEREADAWKRLQASLGASRTLPR